METDNVVAELLIWLNNISRSTVRNSESNRLKLLCTDENLFIAGPLFLLSMCESFYYKMRLSQLYSKKNITEVYLEIACDFETIVRKIISNSKSSRKLILILRNLCSLVGARLAVIDVFRILGSKFQNDGCPENSIKTLQRLETIQFLDINCEPNRAFTTISEEIRQEAKCIGLLLSSRKIMLEANFTDSVLLLHELRVNLQEWSRYQSSKTEFGGLTTEKNNSTEYRQQETELAEALLSNFRRDHKSQSSYLWVLGTCNRLRCNLNVLFDRRRRRIGCNVFAGGLRSKPEVESLLEQRLQTLQIVCRQYFEFFAILITSTHSQGNVCAMQDIDARNTIQTEELVLHMARDSRSSSSEEGGEGSLAESEWYWPERLERISSVPGTIAIFLEKQVSSTLNLLLVSCVCSATQNLSPVSGGTSMAEIDAAATQLVQTLRCDECFMWLRNQVK